MKKLMMPGIILLAVILCNCSEQNPGFISGYIEGLDNDTIYIETYNFDSERSESDTITAQNGKFSYELDTTGNHRTIIIPKSVYETLPSGRLYLNQQQAIIIYTNGEAVTIEAKLHEHYVEFSTQGANHLNFTLDSLRAIYWPQYNASSSKYLEYEAAQAASYPEDTLSKLFNEYLKLKPPFKEAQLKYALKNPGQEISAYFLARQPIDTFHKYHRILEESSTNGFFQGIFYEKSQKLEEYLVYKTNLTKISPGAPAPDFRLSTLRGESFRFHDNLGQYTVLDFWGSWCAPCIQGIPKMKEYSKKYSDLKFISIACNDNVEAAIKTVDTNKIQWLQLMNNDNSPNDVCLLYAVDGYPQKFLIAPDGVIEKIFYGEGDDFYKYIDEKFSDKS